MPKTVKARTATQKRAQRRKARAEYITLPGGETAPQRPAQGRRSDRPSEPADALALAVRARLTGCSLEEARDVLAANDMGRCIRAMIPENKRKPGECTRRDLLSTWQGICAAKHNWQQRITATNPNPQSASLPMLPESMQTDTGHSVDLRTTEERDEAARRVWYHWLDRLMDLPAEQRHALRGHLDGYAAPIWDADELRPTRTGALAVKALRALHVLDRC